MGGALALGWGETKNYFASAPEIFQGKFRNDLFGKNSR